MRIKRLGSGIGLPPLQNIEGNHDNLTSMAATATSHPQGQQDSRQRGTYGLLPPTVIEEGCLVPWAFFCGKVEEELVLLKRPESELNAYQLLYCSKLQVSNYTVTKQNKNENEEC